MSRTVGGEFLLGEKEKEYFVRKMWKVAAFLGIEVLDYVVMSNHYHQLVHVPGVVELSHEELLRRLKAYYGEESLEVLWYAEAFEKGGDQFDALKMAYLKRMGNVSEFEKILKQGFSAWYNKRNKRRGTFWMERFKSVLVEDIFEARSMLAIYIDLNPVRAELVEDPKDYRHCGYAAALAGDKRCQQGIIQITGVRKWAKASKVYRMMLIRRGHKQVAGKKGTIRRELLLETLDKEGRLSKPELLQLRVRYFSDGLVLGSELFVEEIFEQYRSHFGEKRKSGARAIRELAENPLRVIRDLRVDPVS